MNILGAPSPYIKTLAHLASCLIALSLQKAFNDTISHPAFVIWLLQIREQGFPGTILLLLWAKCDSPQLLLGFLLYGGGLSACSKPLHEQKPSRQRGAVRCNLLGPGPFSAPSSNWCMLPPISFIPLLERQHCLPNLHRTSRQIKMLSEFNSISGT